MTAWSNMLILRQSNVFRFGLIHRVETRCFHNLHVPRNKIFSFKKEKSPFLQRELTKYVTLCNLVHVRNNSGTNAPNDVPLPPNYIPEPPVIPDAPVTETVLNSLNEVSLSSVGLGGWSPPGIVQQLLETIHCSFDMPWWSAIVVCTVVLRVLMFPIVVVSQRNMAKLHNHTPTMTKLQQRFTEARASGDPMAAAKSGNDLMTFMQRNEISPMKNFMLPLAQMPVFLSVFFGLRQMANLPVESLKDGGLFWFTDLTIPDPIYGLPILTLATLSLTIEMGTDGVSSKQMGHVIKWAFRCLPIIIFPFMINFPSAMLCYWCTSNFLSLIQVGVLRIPAVRSYFNIERRMDHEKNAVPLPKKKFLEGFKESYNNAKMAQTLDNRHKVDAMKFKEAGQGPIQKTYLYDPTKKKKDPVVSVKSRN